MAQEEDRPSSGRGAALTEQLWQEFKTTYSERGLDRLKAAEIEAKCLVVLQKNPSYLIYQTQLAKLEFLPTLLKMAQLRKRSPYDELEGVLIDFCEAQSPFETYLSAHDRSLEVEAARGERAGAGMQMNRDADGHYSLTPFEDSPAEKAGVLADDELLEVEGKATQKMSIPEIKSLVLGPPNSELTIRVRHTSGGEELLRITRAKHHEPLARIKKTLTGQVLSIRSFNRGSFAEVKKCLSEADENARLTLDLRGNVGGDLEDAVKIASLFLPDGATIYQQKKNNGEVVVVRDEDNTYHSIKSLRLMVDRHTASAGELVTAALLNQAGVSLQGEKTYGKNVITTSIPLKNGGILTLITQEMIGPSGGTWAKGIDPKKWAAGDKPF